MKTNHNTLAPAVDRRNLPIAGPGWAGNISERSRREVAGRVVVEELRNIVVDARLYDELEALKRRQEGDAPNVHRIEGEGYEGTVDETFAVRVYEGSRVMVTEFRTITYEPATYAALHASGSWVPDRYEHRAAPYAPAE